MVYLVQPYSFSLLRPGDNQPLVVDLGCLLEDVVTPGITASNQSIRLYLNQELRRKSIIPGQL